VEYKAEERGRGDYNCYFGASITRSTYRYRTLSTIAQDSDAINTFCRGHRKRTGVLRCSSEVPAGLPRARSRAGAYMRPWASTGSPSRNSRLKWSPKSATRDAKVVLLNQRGRCDGKGIQVYTAFEVLEGSEGASCHCGRGRGPGT
jgi:hypothetical protein